MHISGEYYEHKLCIPVRTFFIRLAFVPPFVHSLCPFPQMHSLAFSERSDEFFDIWDVNESVSYAVKTAEERGRAKWLQRLTKITLLYEQKMAESAQEVPRGGHLSLLRGGGG